MASRNGLNPKIRGLKGVGFNRALPAPFGWGNGIQPDGVNDYMTVPRLINFAYPSKSTIEFWSYKRHDLGNGYAFSVFDSDIGLGLNINLNGTNRLQRFDTNGTAATNYNWLDIEDGLKTHMVVTSDSTIQKTEFYIDGLLKGTNNGVTPPLNIKKFNLFNYAPTGGLYCSFPMDEFRFYRSALRLDQIVTNYNGRIGTNPCETENLLIWFKFERFENLDFSMAQDGFDIRLGMRDYSGNNNHGLPINIDTGPASPTYVLKPF